MYDPAHPDRGIVVNHTPGGSIVLCSGDIDIRSRDRLAEALEQALGAGAELVVVTCKDVGFIDSSGIHTLLKAAREAATRGMKLQLIASPQVRRVVDLLGLGDTLGMTEGRPDPD